MDIWTGVSYLTAVASCLAGMLVYFVFRKNTVEEARSRVSQFVHALVSWPGRFVTYRSGHGKHAYAYTGAS